MAKKKETTELATVDMAAGSRSFNRFELQLSQTLHMAIELYDSLNYLLVLDYYDDITLFDLDKDPLVVSYYQMKTSQNEMTIDSAIEKSWLAKLYTQLCRPEGWNVKELAFITNQPLEVSYELDIDSAHLKPHNKKHQQTDKLYATRTAITDLHQSVQERIRKDIAQKCGIPEEEVDLSKFAHMRTTLTIEHHGDLVEKEMGDFLHKKYPKVTVDTVKGIYSSMLSLLTRKQEYETLPDNAPLDVVKKHKGLVKDEFDRVIDQAIMLSLPEFDDVLAYAQVDKDMEMSLSLPYTRILSDTNNKRDGSFPRLYTITLETIKSNPYDGKGTGWDYAQEIGAQVRAKEPALCIPYDQYYIEVLTICMMINNTRRKS